ncbi:MAG: GNAT family N-acetyltransferase [Clostridiales bacterium]|nr:GNAT family N-acetyltransferase [Clostridiales bacterium]
MTYKQLTLSEYKNLKEKLAKSISKGSEHNFSGFLDWFDDLSYLDDGNAIFIKATAKDHTLNWFPVFYSEKYLKEVRLLNGESEGEAKQAARALIDYAFSVVGNDAVFYFVPREVALNAQVCCYDIYFNRNTSDYIYAAQDFISLKGKKYHAKRNHISKFKSNYNWEFREYRADDYDEVLRLLDAWNENKKFGTLSRESAEYEKQFLKNWLENLEERELLSDVLIADGAIVGVTVGEISPNGVGVVIFEKANQEFEGVYSMLSNSFAKKRFSSLKYINRQEDMGLMGLRKSKLSYNPSDFSERYVLLKKETEVEARYKDSYYKKRFDINGEEFVFKRLDITFYETVRAFYIDGISKLKDPKFFMNYTDEELAAILDGGGFFVGAFKGEELVGTAAVDFDEGYGELLKNILSDGGFNDAKDYPVFELSGIFVKEDFRKMGLAGTLTAEVINIARLFAPNSYLCAVVQYDNIPSKNNLSKLGFKVSARKDYAPYLFDYLTLKL